MDHSRPPHSPERPEHKALLLSKQLAAALGTLKARRFNSGSMPAMTEELQEKYRLHLEIRAKIEQLLRAGNYDEAVPLLEEELAYAQSQQAEVLKRQAQELSGESMEESPETSRERESQRHRRWAAGSVSKRTLRAIGATANPGLRAELLHAGVTEEVTRKERIAGLTFGGDDAVFVRPELGISAVFDGVGTNEKDESSAETIRIAAKLLLSEAMLIPEDATHEEAWHACDALARKLRKTIARAFETRAQSGEQKLGAASAVIALQRGDRVYTINFGDSHARVYRPHAAEGKRSELITNAHDTVARLFKQQPDLIQAIRDIAEEYTPGDPLPDVPLPRPDVTQIQRIYEAHKQRREARGRTRKSTDELALESMLRVLQNTTAEQLTGETAQAFLASVFAARNSITSALAAQETPFALNAVRLGPDDVLMLESDGVDPLTRTEQEQNIERFDEPNVLVKQTINQVAEKTFQKDPRAKAAGDDVTKLVIKNRTGREAAIAYAAQLRDSIVGDEEEDRLALARLEMLFSRTDTGTRWYDMARALRARSETKRIHHVMEQSRLETSGVHGETETRRWLKVSSENPDLSTLSNTYAVVLRVPNPMYHLPEPDPISAFLQGKSDIDKDASALLHAMEQDLESREQPHLIFIAEAQHIEALPTTPPEGIEGKLEMLMMRGVFQKGEKGYERVRKATELEQQPDGSWEANEGVLEWDIALPKLYEAEWMNMKEGSPEEIQRWRDGEEIRPATLQAFEFATMYWLPAHDAEADTVHYLPLVKFTQERPADLPEGVPHGPIEVFSIAQRFSAEDEHRATTLEPLHETEIPQLERQIDAAFADLSWLQAPAALIDRWYETKVTQQQCDRLIVAKVILPGGKELQYARTGAYMVEDFGAPHMLAALPQVDPEGPLPRGTIIRAEVFKPLPRYAESGRREGRLVHWSGETLAAPSPEEEKEESLLRMLAENNTYPIDSALMKQLQNGVVTESMEFSALLENGNTFISLPDINHPDKRIFFYCQSGNIPLLPLRELYGNSAEPGHPGELHTYNLHIDQENPKQYHLLEQTISLTPYVAPTEQPHQDLPAEQAEEEKKGGLLTALINSRFARGLRKLLGLAALGGSLQGDSSPRIETTTPAAIAVPAQSEQERGVKPLRASDAAPDASYAEAPDMGTRDAESNASPAQDLSPPDAGPDAELSQPLKKPTPEDLSPELPPTNAEKNLVQEREPQEKNPEYRAQTQEHTLRVPVSSKGIRLSVRDGLENFLLMEMASTLRRPLTPDERAEAHTEANRAVTEAILARRAAEEAELPNLVGTGMEEAISFEYDSAHGAAGTLLNLNFDTLIKKKSPADQNRDPLPLSPIAEPSQKITEKEEKPQTVAEKDAILNENANALPSAPKAEAAPVNPDVITVGEQNRQLRKGKKVWYITKGGKRKEMEIHDLSSVGAIQLRTPGKDKPAFAINQESEHRILIPEKTEQFNGFAVETLDDGKQKLVFADPAGIPQGEGFISALTEYISARSGSTETAAIRGALFAELLASGESMDRLNRVKLGDGAIFTYGFHTDGSLNIDIDQIFLGK